MRIVSSLLQIVVIFSLSLPAFSSVRFVPVYDDVVNNTGQGFDDPELGETRRDIVSSVLSYASSMLSVEDDVAVRIRFTSYSNPDLLEELAATTNTFVRLNRETHITAPLAAAEIQGHHHTPAPDEHARIRVNFGLHFNYDLNRTVLRPVDGADFYQVILHELTHALGVAAMSRDNNLRDGVQTLLGTYQTYEVDGRLIWIYEGRDDPRISDSARNNISADSQRYFCGYHAVQANVLRAIPMNGLSHFDLPQGESIMATTVAYGESVIRAWTRLDRAILRDLGYELGGVTHDEQPADQQHANINCSLNGNNNNNNNAQVVVHPINSFADNLAEVSDEPSILGVLSASLRGLGYWFNDVWDSVRHGRLRNPDHSNSNIGAVLYTLKKRSSTNSGSAALWTMDNVNGRVVPDVLNNNGDFSLRLTSGTVQVVDPLSASESDGGYEYVTHIVEDEVSNRQHGGYLSFASQYRPGDVDAGRPEVLMDNSGSSEDNPVPVGQGDFTVAFWVQTTQSGTLPPILLKTGQLWIKMDAAGHAIYGFSDISEYEPIVAGEAKSKTLINDGDWHHVALVRDGTSMRLYIDGKIETDHGMTPIHDLGADNASLSIMTDGTNGVRFDGKMDDIFVSKLALPHYAILTLMPAEPHLLASWSLDETLILYLNSQADKSMGQTSLAGLLSAHHPSDIGVVHNVEISDGATSHQDNYHYVFDGSSSYLMAPPQVFRNAAFSVSLWIKPDSSDANRLQILLTQQEEKNSDTPSGYSIRLTSDNKLQAGVWGGADRQLSTPLLATKVTSTMSLATDQWHHVVFVRKQNGELVLYVDGEVAGLFAGSEEGQAHYINTSGQVMVMGARGIVPSTGEALSDYIHYFSGGMDNITVFGRELQPEDVTQLYLEFWRYGDWSLNEAPSRAVDITDVPVIDASGHGHHGEIYQYDEDTQFAGFPGVTDVDLSYRFTRRQETALTIDRGGVYDLSSASTVSLWFRGPIGDVDSQLARNQQFLIAEYAKAGDEKSPLGVVHVDADGSITFTDAGNVLMTTAPALNTTIKSKKDYRDGLWHHVAVTKQPTDSGNGYYTLYVDGKQIDRKDYILNGTGTTVSGWAAAGTYSGKLLVVGNDEAGNTANGRHSLAFDGFIDNILVFNKALTSEELAVTMPPSYARDVGLWAHYTMESPLLPGYNSLDSSGYDHTLRYSGYGRLGDDVALGAKAFVVSHRLAYLLSAANEAVIQGQDNFTASVWVKTTATTQGSILEQRSRDIRGEDGGYYIYMLRGGIVEGRFFGRGQPVVKLYGSAINDGQWHLITISRDNGTYTLYVDNDIAAQQQLSRLPVDIDPDHTARLRVGASPLVGYASMVIDDVRIYKDRAISYRDHLDLYNSRSITGEQENLESVTEAQENIIDHRPSRD